MSLNSKYTYDGEFVKLLTRRTDIDLVLAALELARDAYPDLRFEQTFDWIDERAAELSSRIAGAKTERDALAALADCLSGRHGLQGDRDSYNHADSSYLHRVIERKRGIPISLSLLYMAVGARAGLPLHGVSSPGHFMVRYEAVDGPLFIDAFSRGEVLTHDECSARICRAMDLPGPLAESAFEPAPARTIVIRMLNNLKALHARQSNWQAAWLVQHRLSALHPSTYSEIRDLGLISLKANRPGMALDLLQSCRQRCPEDETEMLDQHVSEAERQLVRWN
ncbi:MAG TPA: transglutaminase-like domain-containing protein [Planctomycetaceae bacterium]|nr:transglutaminase-like domain-containing protein [Planctomycetaceae bacterium]